MSAPRIGDSKESEPTGFPRASTGPLLLPQPPIDKTEQEIHSGEPTIEFPPEASGVNGLGAEERTNSSEDSSGSSGNGDASFSGFSGDTAKGPGINSSSLGIDGLPPGLDPGIFRSYTQRRLELWAQYCGVRVDHHKFSFKDHLFLYSLFSDKAENLVVMKAAQMGATIFMLLKAFHMGLFYDHWGFPDPIKIGFYFPEAKGIGRIVKDRVIPMMGSCDDLKPYSSEVRQDLRPVGSSTIYFLYMGGSTTKDSTPMNVLFFDEVRLVKLEDIYQAYARVLHSWPFRFKNHVSTAHYPGGDIDLLFQNSDQKWFTNICAACGHEQILPQLFPECIAEHTFGPKKHQCYYICEKCRSEIKDPQRGKFIAHNEGHPTSGYQISQLTSRLIQPREILEQYRNTKNMKEFHNHILGLPYVDKVNKPIDITKLDKNISHLSNWGETLGRNYMGVDQMACLNYVFIISKDPLEGKKRVVWFEIIEDPDPFKRTGQLMEEYNVEFAVVDGLPNANDARRFANDFKRKVWLAYYGEYRDVVSWSDDIKKGQRKTSSETVARYQVLLDSYRTVEYTLGLIEKSLITWPDPDKHRMVCFPYAASALQGGKRASYPIMRTHAYPHFACAVRERVILEEESGKDRMRWSYISTDPHALHSLNYAVFASERKGRGFVFSL